MDAKGPDKKFVKIESEDQIEGAVEAMFRQLFPEADYPEGRSPSQDDGQPSEEHPHGEEPQPQDK